MLPEGGVQSDEEDQVLVLAFLEEVGNRQEIDVVAQRAQQAKLHLEDFLLGVGILAEQHALLDGEGSFTLALVKLSEWVEIP